MMGWILFILIYVFDCGREYMMMLPKEDWTFEDICRVIFWPLFVFKE